MSSRRLRTLDKKAVSELKSVSPRKAAGLASMGIESVLDLLTHYPRRYVDRRNASAIGDLVEGEEAMVSGRVVRSSSRRTRNGRTMTEVVVADGTGRLVCTFFNQAWRSSQLPAGREVTVFGTMEMYRASRQMSHPLVDLVGDQTGRLVAVYAQSQKARIGSVDLGAFVAEALERAGDFADPVPSRFLDRERLIERTEAFRSIHRPEAQAAHLAARRRLVFDELLRLQILLVSKKRSLALSASGIAHDPARRELLRAFVSGLPFELTAAQRRAVAEIEADLASPVPMNRLLQGDVGAGKTVVALAALLVGIEGGYQGALMVPTEVLAEQHYLSARQMLADLTVADPGRLGGRRPLAVGLLTSRTPGSERGRLLHELKEGSLDLVCGTQALLTEEVAFAALGVVVVDEQHRFGVEQRARLSEKAGLDPDLLVMTATPIPRSAAMTVYGDLDHTVLDELPAGRTPITTRWFPWHKEAAAWKTVRAELDAGHQAYVICPLVAGGEREEQGEGGSDVDPGSFSDLEPGGARAGGGTSERLVELEPEGKRPLRAAVDEFARLGDEELKGYRVGLLHGQMPAKEKDAVMSAFRRGELQALVATTVVEVGVDVANATAMVIEDADRFGIAQLHQLRGRVGRGDAASTCVLLADADTPDGERRIEALVRSENGFDLAEVDLELRGGGTVLGSRQKGRSDLKLVRLSTDKELVRAARKVAEEVLAADPTMSSPELELLRDEVDLFVSDEERQFLFRG